MTNPIYYQRCRDSDFIIWQIRKKSSDLAEGKYGIYLGREKGFMKVRKSLQIPPDAKR